MKKMIVLLLGIMLSCSGFSQEIKSYLISSSGASITGANGALYLSIGEPLNTEISGGEIMISQGFLQVSISETTTIENVLEEEINVYPNPTNSSLVIEIPAMDGDYEFELINYLGGKLRGSALQTKRSSVDLNSVIAGTYFLRVIKGDKSSKTVKIIKL